MRAKAKSVRNSWGNEMIREKHNMENYEKTYANFCLETPEYFNFARDIFDKWAESPQKLAMLWIDDYGNERKITFGELKESSSQLAQAMHQRGIRKGDKVMVILPRVVEWWETNLACLRIGAIISPGTVMLTPKDIEYRIKMAEIVAVITDEANALKVEMIKSRCPTLKLFIIAGQTRGDWLNYEEVVTQASANFVAENTKSEDDCILYFTSGTTGFPKMVLHSQVSYPLGHIVTGKFWLDLREDDLHWNLADTGWAKAAWSSLYGPWIMGAALFVHHTPRFEPKKTLEILQKYPITTLCGAPTNYRMLVREDLSQYRFPTLRHCVSAGEPLNPEVISIWQRATGLTIRDGYGQSETCCVVANYPCLEVCPGSMGKPIPGFYVAIVDEKGNEVPPGVEGDIAIRLNPERPVGLFKAYWKESEENADCYRGDWYITGDRAIRDESGYFWFVGRADDVIITSGYRIGPFEVESALLEHPAVAECAVVSSPDELRGEVVKAFVVLDPAYQPSNSLVEKLQEYVKGVTAPYKYPRKIDFVDSLPKTPSGKIRRAELRQREWVSRGAML